MDNINYLEIIQKAWQITWHKKYLWWFGLFIALTGSLTNTLNYSLNAGNTDADYSPTTERAIDFLVNNSYWLFWVGLTLVILYIALAIIGVIARAGLILSVKKTLANEYSTFRVGMKTGKKFFGRIFCISLLIYLAGLMFFLVLLTPIIFLFINQNVLAGIILSLFAFLITIPVIILLTFLKLYGYLYAILGDQKTWPAVENAYSLLQMYLKESILMGLLFIAMNMTLGVLLLVPIIPLVLIFGLMAGALYFVIGEMGVIIIVSIGLLVLLSIVTFIQAIYQTFAQTTWIIFFEEIAKPKQIEKVLEDEPKPRVLPVIDPIKPIQ